MDVEIKVLEINHLENLNISYAMSVLPERFEQLDLQELDLGWCKSLTMDAEIISVIKMKNLSFGPPMLFEELTNLKVQTMWDVLLEMICHSKGFGQMKKL